MLGIMDDNQSLDNDLSDNEILGDEAFNNEVTKDKVRENEETSNTEEVRDYVEKTYNPFGKKELEDNIVEKDNKK
ncbi:hypothetical protein [Sporohalobacter salinus]|uniref:hypothetical protein n=1 Tax=Sporohalobacter salinus TaxID=1494606 RepID=UPI001960F905|nr:hypothetical protein [Sporohalobacter salinus]MBM7623361.1 hypothetical protein [Sporohalobacter salinus]